MKRLLVLLLALCTVISLSACGTPAEKADPSGEVTDSPAPSSTSTAAPVDVGDSTDITDPELKLAWDVGSSVVAGGFDTVMDRGTYTLLGMECRLFYYVKDTHFVGESCISPDGTVYIDLTGQLDWMYAEKNADGTYRLTNVPGTTSAPVVTATPDPEEGQTEESEEGFVPDPTPYVPSAGGYAWPVEGFNIVTYQFGEDGHGGVDIAGADIAGAPVCAIADGYVGTVDVNEDGFGLYVTVIHDNGDVYFSLYGQLDSAAVEPGDSVSAGQTVGYVGMSGSATGYHLHLGTYASDDWNSKFNPLALYPDVDIFVWDED